MVFAASYPPEHLGVRTWLLLCHIFIRGRHRRTPSKFNVFDRKVQFLGSRQWWGVFGAEFLKAQKSRGPACGNCPHPQPLILLMSGGPRWFKRHPTRLRVHARFSNHVSCPSSLRHSPDPAPISRRPRVTGNNCKRRRRSDRLH